VNKDASPVQAHSTAVCGNLPGWIGLAVISLTPAACAKRHALPPDELFRRIQVLEASIAEAQLSVRAATDCRAAHAPAEEGVCDPSKALCKLSEGSENHDALQRCLMASDSCRASRERVRALCGMPSLAHREAAEEEP
jgi:hypothetical protein